MSWEWAKTLVGAQLNDFEMLRIPNPRLELTLHVTMKSVQVGTLVGSLLTPLVAYAYGNRASGGLRDSFVNGGVNGALVGLIAGPLFTAIYTNNLDTLELYDLCYRLRFNIASNRAARMSLLGSTLGGLAGGPAGAVIGVDVSVIASIIANKII